MRQLHGFFALSGVIATLALTPDLCASRPRQQQNDVTPVVVEVDRIGPSDAAADAASKAAYDTVWVADWSFDGSGGCDDSGWQGFDNYILNDGELYWNIEPTSAGTGGVTGQAAVLGQHNLCWVYPDGYGNNWYQGIRIPYAGRTLLSFDYVIDSEDGYDAVMVESDEDCASYELAAENPPYSSNSMSYRVQYFWDSGLQPAGRVDSLLLTDHGAPTDTHCVYISFWSDGCCSPADGWYVNPTLGIALAIDNIVLEDAGDPASPTLLTWSEDFEDATLDAPAFFLNMQDSIPYGHWGRLFEHATDNDICDENPSCAWIWTDPTLQADDDRFVFGPNGTVVRDWLDDVIIGPWVSLGSVAAAQQTVISFRRFPGSFFSYNRRVQNWSVRGKHRIDNTDSPAPGDSIDCVPEEWGHASNWNSLSSFRWQTRVEDMTPYIHPDAEQVQLRFRVSDWQWIGSSPPVPFIRNPGPYLDRVRIGRLVAPGPLFSEGIDSRRRAQDAFPTVQNGIPGEHYSPSNSRFGSAAFSMAADIGAQSSPNLIVGDSITIAVMDARNAGGIAAVQWYGAIVSGPHAGKAPPPWVVGANGFFAVQPDSVRDDNGILVDNTWSVDVDDDYFRGGDVLHYYWSATDALGATATFPEGLEATPASVHEAEAACGGLLEVSFLPAINWDPVYVARIQSDAHGKLEPTAAELSASTQAHCILYVQQVNLSRRSGPQNRTSFMYTLDRLGYQDGYDVYDVNGLGNTNNQLGGRATLQQVTGYAILIYDTGNLSAGSPLLPDGSSLYDEKIDQAQWFLDWLAAAATSEIGSATLWMIGSDLVEEKGSHPLFTDAMRAGLVSAQQASAVRPEVTGIGSFVWAHGDSSNFATDDFYLSGACPAPEDYDALVALAPAVVSHRFRNDTTLGDAATVLHADAAGAWNTVMTSFAWSDIRQVPGSPQSMPALEMASKIISTLATAHCDAPPLSTDTVEGETTPPPPTRTVLLQNTPNPFNPTTRIEFHLARSGPVELVIYDIAGRRIRTLVREVLEADEYSLLWNGRGDNGQQATSGVYVYRLQTPAETLTRKMLLLK